MTESEHIRSDSLTAAFEELNERFNELNGTNPRAAVILAAAILDDELKKLILRKFPVNLSRQVQKTLFSSPTTPFGTYDAKNRVARAFGYYGTRTYNKLCRIGEIRNKFAHTARIKFSDERIVVSCRRLFSNTQYAFQNDIPHLEDMQLYFVDYAQDLAMAINDLSNDSDAAPLP